MKTTIKEFQSKNADKKHLNKTINKYTDFIRESINTTQTDRKLEAAQNELDELLKSYFDCLETVFVEYWVGSRKYANEVIKIGKQYFLLGYKMTKSSGYSSIMEVPFISEQMKEEMISDSHYY